MKEWLLTNRYPEFYDIDIPSTLSSTYFLESIYETLKLMGDGKEKYLVSHWKFLSTRYIINDHFLIHSAESLINTKYAKSIDILWSTERHNWTEYFYNQFKISKFNVRHIDILIQLNDPLKLFAKELLNEDAQKEFSLITSISVPSNYGQIINNLNMFKSLHNTQVYINH